MRAATSKRRKAARHALCRRTHPVVVALLLVVGCGSEQPPAPVPDALPGTPPEVEAALLTTEDLGKEWIDIGAVPLDQRGFDGCPPAQVITAVVDPERVGEAQSGYVKGDPPAPYFGESISLWTSAEVAHARLRQFASQTSQCRSFTDKLADGRPATLRVSGRKPPQLGDEAVAVVVQTDPADGPVTSADVVVIRHGKALILTESHRVDADPPVGLEQSGLDALTRQAVDKAQDKLPQARQPGAPPR